MKTLLILLALAVPASAQNYIHDDEMTTPDWIKNSRYQNFAWFDYCPDEHPDVKPPSSVPEPGSFIIWAIAGGWVVGATRKRRCSS